MKTFISESVKKAPVEYSPEFLALEKKVAVLYEQMEQAGNALNELVSGHRGQMGLVSDAMKATKESKKQTENFKRYSSKCETLMALLTRISKHSVSSAQRKSTQHEKQSGQKVRLNLRKKKKLL